MTKTAFLPHIVPDPPIVPKADPVPPTDPAELARILLPSQGEISAYFSEDGNLVLVEKRWPDEDAQIIIGADMLDAFIDRLTDLLGYGSTGQR